MDKLTESRISSGAPKELEEIRKRLLNIEAEKQGLITELALERDQHKSTVEKLRKARDEVNELSESKLRIEKDSEMRCRKAEMATKTAEESVNMMAETAEIQESSGAADK